MSLARPHAVRRRSRRRRAAASIALWPVGEVLAAVLSADGAVRHLPLGGSSLPGPLAVMAGVGVWATARGLRRGQRSALYVAVGFLTATAAWLAAGDVPGLAVVPVAEAVLIASARDSFQVMPDSKSLRRGMLLAGLALPGVVVLERLEIVPDVALLTVALVFAAGAGWLATRPPVRPREVDARGGLPDRARRIIAAHSIDHLDYFALRDDKQLFFHGRSVIAFAVVRGVCIVSPDPIGPGGERAEVWQAFRRFADDHGWLVGVLGAGEAQLAFYRGEGMRLMYLGDDAVVDCQTFHLAGRRLKSLRQGVHRAARRGYEVELCAPAAMSPELRAEVAALAVRGRLGGYERGFSMTLGRMFDARDEQLLVGLCRAPSGQVVACCQFVPAPGGYCLDVMRREPGAEHGVVDLILVRMIERMRELGLRTLGLNFAAWRAIVAGEREDSPRERFLRWGVAQLSKSFQVESLWEFTRKYQPSWIGRYAAYDAIEDLAGCMLAVAKAESYWELPLIGRFMLPVDADGRRPAEAGGVAAAVVPQGTTA